MNSGYSIPPCPAPAAVHTLTRIREHLGRMWAMPDSSCEWSSLCKIRSTREYSLDNVNLSSGLLVLVLQGKKLMRRACADAADKKQQWSVSSGGMVYLPPGQRLSFCNIPEAGQNGNVEYLAISINLPEEVLQQVRQRIAPQANLPEYGDGGPVSVLMLNALETFLRVLPENDKTLSHMQQEQLVYLLWKHGIPVFSTFNPLVRRIRSLVEEEPARPWSTAQLADLLCMTERTLRRHLEKSGTSVAELVRLSRLHRGLGLLQRESLSVGEVAAMCGYTSQSRFAQRFREQFGVLPSKVQ